MPVGPVPFSSTVDFTSVPLALISDFERARAANFRHTLHAKGGRAARRPESHAAVMHGADQRSEMGTGRNPIGRALGVPVAFKRHRVGSGALRAGKLRLRAEDDDYKEKKTRRGLGNIAEYSGETQKPPSPQKKSADAVPAATGQQYPAVCQVSAGVISVKTIPLNSAYFRAGNPKILL